ncbi:FAD-dependent oxidoreductase (plasmid) [Agrobacterium leguminum]|uniref:FAD-dependent oxidoreductase n=1 Tax=Agrobacterium leguminum TaxID=2792015 RepID=UPI0030D09BAB
METVKSVVVVGAGPVGLMVALGLARKGIDVTVLEAEKSSSEAPRAAVYYPVSLDVLESLGLFDDIKAAGYTSTEFQFRVPEKKTVISLDSSVLNGAVKYPYNLHLGQHALSVIILEHLARLPNVDIRWNNRVVDIQQDGKQVSVEIETANGRIRLLTEWLVGTDGGRSTVRTLLGISFEGHTWPDRFVATNVRYDFEKYGYAPINQVADPVNWAVIARLGQENLWRLTYGEDPNLSEEECLRRIPEHYAAILPDPRDFEIVAASPYRIHERCAVTFRAGHVLLAGDAAHVCNPCGGMGLTTGIIDAAVLCDALSAVISGTGSETLLDFYAAERRRVFLEVTTAIASNFKRALSERDPQRRSDDENYMRHSSLTSEAGRSAMMYPAAVLGAPLPL